MKTRLVLTLGTLSLALLAVSSCTGDDTIVGSSSDRLPNHTLTDWVSYGDQVIYFTVLSEQEMAWGEHEQQEGEGYVGREVTVQYGDELWRRPNAIVPNDDTFAVAGWALKDGEKTKFAIEGHPRIEVGETYLAVLTYSAPGGEPPLEWGPLAGGAVIPVDEQGVPEGGDFADDSALAAISGKSPAEIESTISSAEPNPVAAEHFDVNAVTRYNAVLLEDMPSLPGFEKAIGDGGAIGYVRTADLEQQTLSTDAASISLYDENGEIVIDTYTPGDGLLHQD